MMASDQSPLFLLALSPSRPVAISSLAAPPHRVVSSPMASRTNSSPATTTSHIEPVGPGPPSRRRDGQVTSATCLAARAQATASLLEYMPRLRLASACLCWRLSTVLATAGKTANPPSTRERGRAIGCSISSPVYSVSASLGATMRCQARDAPRCQRNRRHKRHPPVTTTATRFGSTR